MMNIIISYLESTIICKWHDIETRSHYGNAELSIGEELSILAKMHFTELEQKASKKCSFNLAELEILSLWGHNSFGLFEEDALKEKISKALEVERANFIASLQLKKH